MKTVEQVAAERGIDIPRALRNLRTALTRRARHPGPTPHFPGIADRRWQGVGAAPNHGIPFASRYSVEIAQKDLDRVLASADPTAEYVRIYEVRNRLKRTV